MPETEDNSVTIKWVLIIGGVLFLVWFAWMYDQRYGSQAEDVSVEPDEATVDLAELDQLKAENDKNNPSSEILSVEEQYNNLDRLHQRVSSEDKSTDKQTANELDDMHNNPSNN